ncbi:Predicted nuclease of the RNAse H fold, HicB family [Marinobacter sp. LV10R510-11A]|uniref:type II toxin-antitoxin system HicB family antitoxin n=1 Tax=Marinobacter sp. LV10R510-11A TaxID=1415568 RepID=UPI000BB8666E|nr:type II toxin-antitoxin system HicB family antitoxin [Marinobacter sp. LV10R510-11A]SOB78476.1 Predicted nuclease of the RNAse H fold, HicB family [Marinobacter sp. LV10R510-11A]
MRFPVALHTDNGKKYGVTVPDIPGCFSAGASEDEALDNAREAILGHLELLAEFGEEIPSANLIAEHRANPDFEGAVWGFVEIDVTPFLGKAEKINITVPRLVLIQIDRFVKEHPNEARSRSAFLSEAALERMRKLRDKALA